MCKQCRNNNLTITVGRKNLMQSYAQTFRFKLIVLVTMTRKTTSRAMPHFCFCSGWIECKYSTITWFYSASPSWSKKQFDYLLIGGYIVLCHTKIIDQQRGCTFNCCQSTYPWPDEGDSDVLCNRRAWSGFNSYHQHRICSCLSTDRKSVV